MTDTYKSDDALYVLLADLYDEVDRLDDNLDKVTNSGMMDGSFRISIPGTKELREAFELLTANSLRLVELMDDYCNNHLSNDELVKVQEHNSRGALG